MNKKGTLIFFCGKMGAGKSTLSKEIAKKESAILLSEDEWLKDLYPDEIDNFEDYIKYSTRLKPLIKKHVQELLNYGASVVMDFPGNTQKQRTWFKSIYTEYHFSHKLIYIEASDELCIKQIKQRASKTPERVKFDTEEVFNHVIQYFQPPSESEGFNIELINREECYK